MSKAFGSQRVLSKLFKKDWVEMPKSADGKSQGKAIVVKKPAIAKPKGKVQPPKKAKNLDKLESMSVDPDHAEMTLEEKMEMFVAKALFSALLFINYMFHLMIGLLFQVTLTHICVFVVENWVCGWNMPNCGWNMPNCG